ncbi:hypothetical protein [Dactylosporangium sp. NPDC005555]
MDKIQVTEESQRVLLTVFVASDRCRGERPADHEIRIRDDLVGMRGS